MAPEIEASDDDLRVFLQEADEQLAVLDEDIIRLEREGGNVDLMQRIFRAAHTLKGSSGMLGFRDMAELTHHMEDLLDKVRKGQLAVTAELIDALLMSLDGLKALKENLGSSEPGIDIKPIIAAIEIAAVAGGAAPVAAGREPLDAVIAADPSLLERVRALDGALRILVRIDESSPWASVRMFQAIQELTGQGEIVASSPTAQQIEQEQAGFELEVCFVGTGAEQVEAAVRAVDDMAGVEVTPFELAEAAIMDAGEPAREQGGETHKVEAQQTIRIDVERLDAMMNMVGELIIDRTRVNKITQTLHNRYAGDETLQALDEIAGHIGKVVEELNESMLKARMLPVGVIFGKFPRLIRDTARSTGKEVDFLTDGEETEIDRTIIEKIKDPLMHLLRNAVDHGIEPPETRVAAGKQRQGTVRLSARHEQGRIVIQLDDDGKGIDAASLREAAVAKGVIAPEVAARLSEAESLDLIFQSGFSTAAKTTDISGRGVGMDVVRNSIHALNGTVSVETKVGAGLTFTISLPLTLATFPGLLVESLGAVYAVPLSYVQETGQLAPKMVQRIVDKEVINLRGTVMPLLRLSRIKGARRTAAAPGADEDYMVIVKVGERLAAIAVDGLIEQQEVVVKSLGAHAGQARGVAGASILGDGQVALILDVASLMKAA